MSGQDEVGAPAEGETIFDVDAWLTEARPPQRAVVVYGRGDLLSRLQELDAAPEAPTGRLGGSGRGREMAALREQIEASRRVIHVRGLLHTERNALLEKYRGRPEDPDEAFDGDGYQTEALSLAAIQPQFTPAQVERLHNAIGEAQWLALWQAIDKATVEPVDVPLSQLGSEDTPAS